MTHGEAAPASRRAHPYGEEHLPGCKEPVGGQHASPDLITRTTKRDDGEGPCRAKCATSYQSRPATFGKVTSRTPMTTATRTMTMIMSWMPRTMTTHNALLRRDAINCGGCKQNRRPQIVLLPSGGAPRRSVPAAAAAGVAARGAISGNLGPSGTQCVGHALREKVRFCLSKKARRTRRQLHEVHPAP